MSAYEWVKNNYMTGSLDVIGECIVWGDGRMFYGIYTPIDKFIEMFGGVIQSAIDNGEDVKEAIRAADPDDARGFNNIL